MRVGATRASQATRAMASEHVGLHLIEAEFELPPLVVERDDLGRRIGDGIEQGGEQRLAPERSPCHRTLEE